MRFFFSVSCASSSSCSSYYFLYRFFSFSLTRIHCVCDWWANRGEFHWRKSATLGSQRLNVMTTTHQRGWSFLLAWNMGPILDTLKLWCIKWFSPIIRMMHKCKMSAKPWIPCLFVWARAFALFSLMRIEMEKYDKFFFLCVMCMVVVVVVVVAVFASFFYAKIFHLAHFVHSYARAWCPSGFTQPDKKCKSVHQSHNTCR